MTVDRYLVVSTDSHVGPEVDVYRDYCDEALADDLAQHITETDALIDSAAPGWGGAANDDLAERQAEDRAVNDPHERLRNMDADGVAAEVIFHGNNHHRRSRGYIPFANVTVGGSASRSWDLDHQAAGKRMFNRWLADFCSVAPRRLLGVAEMPYWNVDAAVREVRWAAEAGLSAINLAAPREGMPTYDDMTWEPFWSAVEEADLSLNCHSGTGLHAFPGAGAAWRALFWSEIHFVGRMPVPMMIFGGVFERHPGLRLVLNEQRGYWVPQALRELDAIYLNPINDELRSQLPELPSSYWRSNCFVGGSFLAHFELEHRDEIGVETITWGRDYPHLEGTWPHTSEALRAAFHDVPTEQVRMILGTNAVRCYRLDAEPLAGLAADIGPHPDAVAQPLESAPPDARSWAFRDMESAVGGARFGAY